VNLPRDLFPNGDFPTLERSAFLKIVEKIASAGEFKYLEIGSYLGGSLAPLLIEEKCKAVLSIDDRGRILPDQRGQSFDYSAVTELDMIENLSKSGFPINKLKCFDGSIENYDFAVVDSFEFCFIDGEHTNEAVFRDFIYSIDHMNNNAAILFDDSNLVFDGIKNCKTYLDMKKVKYKIFHISDTRLILIVINDFIFLDFSDLSTSEDITHFYQTSSVDLVRINTLSLLTRMDLIKIFFVDRGFDRIKFHILKVLNLFKKD